MCGEARQLDTYTPALLVALRRWFLSHVLVHVYDSRLPSSSFVCDLHVVLASSSLIVTLRAYTSYIQGLDVSSLDSLSCHESLVPLQALSRFDFKTAKARQVIYETFPLPHFPVLTIIYPRLVLDIVLVHLVNSVVIRTELYLILCIFS